MLSQPRAIFGVHSVSPYNTTNGNFYGIGKIVKDSTIAVSSELVALSGGSARWPWAIEDAGNSGEMNLKFGQLEDWMFEVFFGKAPTASGADTAGAVSTAANKYGTSVIAATGLASVTVLTASKANLKFGKYVIKVASATTIDLYASTDIDFDRGADKEFESDLLKVTASALTITTGGTTDLADFGLRFTGGAGTIGMTVGDTATFEVKPPSTKSMEVTIGGSTDTPPEFGCIAMAQRRGNQEMLEIDVFRAKGAGLPLGMAENAFGEPEIKAQMFYDASRNGVMKIRHITPS